MGQVRISYSKRFERQLSKVPVHIRNKVQLWIYAVKTKGLRDVAKSPGYHDEPLQGYRKGQRSVRLSRSYRLIYQIILDSLHIELIEVNKHDY